MKNEKILKVLFICGPSGSGKSYIERMLSEYKDKSIKFNKLTQVTTRARRTIDEDSYIFLNNDLYDQMDSKHLLFAKTNINGDKYGTIDSIKEDSINTIIVNSSGLNNAIEFLTEQHSRSGVDFRIIYIDSDVLEERVNRDSKFIDEERILLENLYDVKIYNNVNNRIEVSKVIETLENLKFI